MNSPVHLFVLIMCLCLFIVTFNIKVDSYENNKYEDSCVGSLYIFRV